MGAKFIPMETSTSEALLKIKSMGKDLSFGSAYAKTKNKKRKWREIEAIQDRYRLQKELEDMDLSLEAELDNLGY